MIMINNAAGYPPYEGPITQDPDPPGPPLYGGFAYTVTIPFLGVPSGQGSTLVAADGGTVTLTGTTITNPGFESLASFSSWGPRSGDSFLKPNVTAPGVSIFSAGMGTGTGAAERLGHLDGRPARDRHGCARQAGASELAQGEVLGCGDREHRRPGRRLELLRPAARARVSSRRCLPCRRRWWRSATMTWAS